MRVAERVRGHLHPWLAELRDHPETEAAFWARVAEARTPLIEPDPATPAHSLVTYVFRDPDAAHVVFNDFDDDAAASVMERIADTAVWHACYRYRDDVRVTYRFAPNMPVTSFKTATQAQWAELRDFLRDAPATSDPNACEIFVSRAGEGLP